MYTKNDSIQLSNKEAVGTVDRCPAHLSQRIMKKEKLKYLVQFLILEGI